MVGGPVQLDVRSLFWDEENEGHVLAHGVRRQSVNQVLAGAPKFFINYPERAGSHLMVGPAESGVFFIVSIRKFEGDGVWRPVTAWHVGERKARRLYDRQA